MWPLQYRHRTVFLIIKEFCSLNNFIGKTEFLQLNIVGQASRLISTGELKALLPLHLLPIDHVVYVESLAGTSPEGNLILGGAWHLDAFSAYPFQT